MIGLGGRVYYSTNGTTYTELPNIKETGPIDDAEAEQVEETPLNPVNRRREWVPGLVNSGKFTFMQYYTATRYDLLRAYLENGTSLYWRVVAPDNSNPTLASKWEFRGNLARWRAPTLKVSESMLIDAEIQVTGVVTFTPGS